MYKVIVITKRSPTCCLLAQVGTLTSCTWFDVCFLLKLNISLPYQWRTLLGWGTIWQTICLMTSSPLLSLKGSPGSTVPSTHSSGIARASVGDQSNVDIVQLDQAVLHSSQLGLAPSTTRVYKTAEKCFTAFCVKLQIVQPFPVNELLLCRFVESLAREGLAPTTMKTYLAGVRHAQVMRGLPEPRQTGQMPRLKLLQAGVTCE